MIIASCILYALGICIQKYCVIVKIFRDLLGINAF